MSDESHEEVPPSETPDPPMAGPLPELDALGVRYHMEYGPARSRFVNNVQIPWTPAQWVGIIHREGQWLGGVLRDHQRHPGPDHGAPGRWGLGLHAGACGDHRAHEVPRRVHGLVRGGVHARRGHPDQPPVPPGPGVGRGEGSTVGVVDGRACEEVPGASPRVRGTPIDLTGQRFDHLQVVRQAPRPPTARHRRLMWECRCDCGNITIVVGKLLRRGETKSCGCLRLEATRTSRRKAPGHSGMVELWHAYKKGAASRGIEFHLSQERFKDLTSVPCHYCGSPPRVARWMRGKKMTEEGKRHSTYVSNGVDRVDSSLGYTEENCVPCCKFCNYAKRALPVDVFIEWARQLVAYQDQKTVLTGA